MMKKAIYCAVMAAALVSAPTGVYADGFKLQPGKYELNGLMKMPMMPNGMPVNNTQCITEEQTQMNAEDIAKQMSAGEDCSIDGLTLTDSKMNFKFACSGGEMGQVNGTYDINFTKTTYSIDGKFTAASMGMTMEMQANAKRVGDC
ncbi:MAG: DUF3617 family protein [Pseudomonadota bacterium]